MIQWYTEVVVRDSHHNVVKINIFRGIKCLYSMLSRGDPHGHTSKNGYMQYVNDGVKTSVSKKVIDNKCLII